MRVAIKGAGGALGCFADRKPLENVFARSIPVKISAVELILFLVSLYDTEQAGRTITLSNNIMQKGLAFGRVWSSSVVSPER